MKSKYMPYLLTAIGFLGVISLCLDNEDLNLFLLSKLVGFFLLSVSYGLSKLLKYHINIKLHKEH